MDTGKAGCLPREVPRSRRGDGPHEQEVRGGVRQTEGEAGLLWHPDSEPQEAALHQRLSRSQHESL